MISEAELAHWRSVVPWVERSQVEQDLVLSRLIIEIARHPLLESELVFRGGTCFHKLWLDRSWRYSEDLDYVRRSATGVGEVFDALREVARGVGFDDIATQVGRHPKVRLRSTLVDGGRLQFKIEMNTFERSPARPTVTRHFAVDSPWFSGEAAVSTFTIEELTATKIRALFQRRKGRDLFDLWLASNTVLPRSRASSNASGHTDQTAGQATGPWRTSTPSSTTRRSSMTSMHLSPANPRDTTMSRREESRWKSSKQPIAEGNNCTLESLSRLAFPAWPRSRSTQFTACDNRS